MAKKFNMDKLIHTPTSKNTSVSSNPVKIKWSTMNKHKRRSHKLYRGQGR